MADTSESTRGSDAKSTTDTDVVLTSEDQVELQDPEKQGVDQDASADVADEPSVPSDEGQAPEPEATKATKRPSVFVPMLLGGVAAAAIGFAVARYVIPEGWPVAGAGVSRTAQDLAAQTTKVQTLEAQVVTLTDQVGLLPTAATIADLQTFRAETETRLSAVETSIEGTLQDLSDFETRLGKAEMRPLGAGDGASGAAIGAYQKELDELRTALAVQRTENAQMAANIGAVADKAQAQIEAAQQQAASKSRAATSRAALSRVQASIESGAGYSAALADLADSGVEIPATLAQNAEAGVPSVAELQRRFPELARQALDASIKATVGAGAMDKLGAFLRTQVGGRSLSPREGDDPDAVLSRAEAALGNGSVADALTELESLPEAGREVMAPWVASATLRVETLAAADALTQSLNQN
ncbi:COG4223 family protein [Pseudogemmobacter sp. W21_MBD1_M6]|uniref:COG4223 family protein n=1 Tax=Pseudogemmobacter sp. W21_MBD1_M6 TaxID=3240271 RepID=UPI003F9C90D6